jgi:hypothetical protein
MNRVLVLGLLGFFAAAGLASSSGTDMRPGGLVFITSKNVVLESEDLLISPEEIRADYRFRNTGERPETVTVAFPMPELAGNPTVIPAIPDPHSSNFLAFQVTVDGSVVTPNLQQRAEVAGIDVTEVLKASGLPLEPFSDGTIAKIEALSEEARRAFIRRGLIVVNQVDDGSGEIKIQPRPYWTLRTTYHWEMTFQPGEETLVTHRFTPSVSRTPRLSFIEDGLFTGRKFDEYVNRYCMSNAFLALVRERIEASQGIEGALHENRIAYELTSGRNWGAPIERLVLTIDKGGPENLVSFCADGVEQTGPTTFTAVRHNVEPDSDLDILILSPGQ